MEQATRELLTFIKGLPEDEAEGVITAAGMVMRVVERDGEAFFNTLEYRRDRINVRIAKGLVLEANIG